MQKKALLVTLKAKPGQEATLESFLKSGVAIANQEAGTVAWYAIKIDASTFGIFDTFADDAGRDAHLGGDLAAALMAKADALLAEGPDIKKVDVLAAK